MSTVTLPEFLNMSLALWTEEHLRLQPLKDFSSLLEEITPADAKREYIPAQRDVKRQNEESMAALKAMMAGVRKR